MVIFMKHIMSAILMLGKSPIKWRQRPDMTIAVDWDVKNQFKQTKRVNYAHRNTQLVEHCIQLHVCDVMFWKKMTS